MPEVSLHYGDCLDWLPTLPAQSVDLIATDLPYGTTACSWDVVIPFAPMWAAVKRVLKPRGAFITTASQPFTSALVMSNLEWFRQEAAWNKVLPVGFLDANRRLMRVHENILIFSPAGYTTYNPQMTIRGEQRWKGGGSGGVDDVYHPYGPRRSCNNEYYPTTMITVSNGDRTRSEVGYHPTQKPVALYEYLIRTYSNPGDVVCDFVMGSGTTGVAAIQTGREFWGCEMNAEYFAIAEKRIAQAQLQPPLFAIDEKPKLTQADFLTDPRERKEVSNDGLALERNRA